MPRKGRLERTLAAYFIATVVGNINMAESHTAPVPGQPHTYERIANDVRRYGADPTIVLVPINDKARHRRVYVKVEEGVFRSLPAHVQGTAWFLVADGGRKHGDTHRLTVRAGGKGNEQITISRLIMGARPGQAVSCISGNRLDLRRSNLRFRRDNMGSVAKRDDTEIVRKWAERAESRLVPSSPLLSAPAVGDAA